MKDQAISFLDNLNKYASGLFTEIGNLSFAPAQIIIICLGLFLLLFIFLLTGSAIYKRKVRKFWDLQNKLLSRCRELEAQSQKIYVPSAGEDKIWHEAETDFIFKLLAKIAATFKREIVIKNITEGVQDFLNTSQTILLLSDKVTKELEIASSIGVDESLIKDFPLKPGESISGFVIAQNRALQVDDLEKDGYLNKINKEKYLKGNFISIPIVFENNILGVLNVCNKKNLKLFSNKDLALLINVGKVAAITLQNISLYEQVNENYFKTISALASAIDARDPYTKYHSENVTKYSLLMADELHLSSHEREVLNNAALLHDIGKIAIRDNVLLKESKLTDEEFEKIKLHPSKGEEMLKFLSFLKEASPIIRHHHERYDGTGYPDKIKGREIELGARIIAVADSFDAMTTDRPYRKSLPLAEVIKELERCKASQFDPEIAALFIEMLKRDPAILSSKPAN